MSWYVYIAKGKDNTLYTGITTDISRREIEHNTDNILGAKSLRHKRPIKIIYYEMCETQSQARMREVEIKSWKRKYKLRLVQENTRFTRKFSR